MAWFFALCAASALIGYAVVMLAAPFMLKRFAWRRGARLSYGGVLRHCPMAGGPLLASALIVTLVPLVGFGILDGGFPLLTLVTSIIGGWAGSLPGGVSRWVFRVGASALLILLPDHCFVAFVAVMIVAILLVVQIARADAVAGVPAALYGPSLAAGGCLVLFSNQHPLGLLGVACAGALFALQKFHRFPPRVILGPSGIAVLVLAHLIIGIELARAGEWFALVLLWSFGWTEFLSTALRGPRLNFERAQQRGEPETGLALATSSLSIANVVVLWTFLEQSSLLQMLASLASLFLAYQFLRYLDRGAVSRVPRAPWHEQI